MSWIGPENVARPTKGAKVTQFVAREFAGTNVIYMAFFEGYWGSAMDAFPTVAFPNNFA
jgi:hypothetical protein